MNWLTISGAAALAIVIAGGSWAYGRTHPDHKLSAAILPWLRDFSAFVGGAIACNLGVLIHEGAPAAQIGWALVSLAAVVWSWVYARFLGPRRLAAMHP